MLDRQLYIATVANRRHGGVNSIMAHGVGIDAESAKLDALNAARSVFDTLEGFEASPDLPAIVHGIAKLQADGEWASHRGHFEIDVQSTAPARGTGDPTATPHCPVDSSAPTRN